MLREFWFQIFLALAGTVSGLAGSYTGGGARKACWVITGLLWVCAASSYMWGDPVRGPFYGLSQHAADDKFRFHGGGIRSFSIKELSQGIVFSDVFDFGGKRPIALKVSRTWWSGWNYEIELKVRSPDRIHISNDTISGLPAGWDFNNDDNAVEVVDKNGIPIFQLIQLSDYDIYVNAIVKADEHRYVILNGDESLINVDERMAMQSRLTPIFKYPGYKNKGKRV